MHEQTNLHVYVCDLFFPLSPCLRFTLCFGEAGRLSDVTEIGNIDSFGWASASQPTFHAHTASLATRMVMSAEQHGLWNVLTQYAGDAHHEPRLIDSSEMTKPSVKMRLKKQACISVARQMGAYVRSERLVRSGDTNRSEMCSRDAFTEL